MEKSLKKTGKKSPPPMREMVLPSEQDILLTLELHLVGGVVSIEVLDHVIIGFRTYVSLKEEKIL